MEAIYFGDAHWQGNSGAGTGPWVGADVSSSDMSFQLLLVYARAHLILPPPQLTHTHFLLDS
jgi:hypothetical protein